MAFGRGWLFFLARAFRVLGETPGHARWPRMVNIDWRKQPAAPPTPKTREVRSICSHNALDFRSQEKNGGGASQMMEIRDFDIFSRNVVIISRRLCGL